MDSISDPQRVYIEEMGVLVERNGNQRSTGRVLATLMLSARPLTQEDLMRLLDLSRTSASVALSWLSRLGYVRQVSEPGDRKRYYQIRPDITERLVRLTFRHIRDELQLMKMAEAAADAGARARITQMREMSDFINARIETSFDEWCRSHAGVCESGSREPALAGLALEGQSRV
jgi:DNA-binding transcriptional regulator GbsR (MarR family)